MSCRGRPVMQSVPHPWFNNLFWMLHWMCIYGHGSQVNKRLFQFLHCYLFCQKLDLVIFGSSNFCFQFWRSLCLIKFQKVAFVLLFFFLWQWVTTIILFSTNKYFIYYGVFTAWKGMRWYIVKLLYYFLLCEVLC